MGKNWGVRGGRDGRVWVDVIPGAKLRYSMKVRESMAQQRSHCWGKGGECWEEH